MIYNISKITLVTVLCLNACSAYSFFGIPLPWIGSILSLPYIFFYKNISTKYIYFFILLLFELLISNILNINNISIAMPQLATTNYNFFIILRYINLLAFLSSIILVSTFLDKFGLKKLLLIIIDIGFLVSVYALFVYILQLQGWPEIFDRNRVGTNGSNQIVEFSYLFHRAMGSFREPSHLAEWLLVPAFSIFMVKNQFLTLKSVVILSVILLTGSMAIYMSFIFGLILTLIFSCRNLDFSLKSLFKYLILIILLIYIINIFLDNKLYNQISERIISLLSGGIIESNRGYVYEFVSILPFRFFGYGLGNSNLIFTDFRGSSFVESFLSVYWNIFCSGGILGAMLLLIFLGAPLKKFLFNKLNITYYSFFALWLYLSWLVNISVNSEELSLMFAISYSLLINNQGHKI